jgi:hypothetical protein
LGGYLYGQDSLACLEVAKDTLFIKGQIDSLSNAYEVLLKVSNRSGGKVTGQFSVGKLRFSGTQRILDGSDITIEPAAIQIEPTDTFNQLPLIIKGFNRPGNFSAKLNISSCNKTQSIPVMIKLGSGEFNLRLANDAELIETSIVPTSWLSFLIPPRFRSKNLSFAVYNDGEYSMSFRNQSIRLIRKDGGPAMVDSNFIRHPLKNMDFEAKERTNISIPILDTKSLVAGSYEGSVELYFNSTDEKLKQPVKVNVRGSLPLAVLFLLLGMVFGISWRIVSRNKDKYKFEDTLRLQRLKIRTLRSDHARRALSLQMEELFDELGNFADAAIKKKLEKGLKSIKDKYVDIVRVERILGEIFAQDSNAPDAKEIAEAAIENILQDNKDAAIRNLQELNNLLTNMYGGDQKSITYPSQNLTQERTIDQPKGKDRTDQVPTWVPKLLTFDFMYKVGRHLITVAILILTLLWGLHEIYFADSRVNFGSEGYFDYLLLFGWGTASDIFSWSVIGEKFLGINEKKEKTNS